MKLWGCVDFGHGVFIELLLVYFLFFRFASSFESGCGHLFALFFGQRRNLNLFLYLGLFLLDFLFLGLLFDLFVHLLDRGYGLFFVNFSFFAIMRVSFRFVEIRKLFPIFLGVLLAETGVVSHQTFTFERFFRNHGVAEDFEYFDILVVLG